MQLGAEEGSSSPLERAAASEHEQGAEPEDPGHRDGGGGLAGGQDEGVGDDEGGEEAGDGGQGEDHPHGTHAHAALGGGSLDCLRFRVGHNCPPSL